MIIDFKGIKKKSRELEKDPREHARKSWECVKDFRETLSLNNLHEIAQKMCGG